MKICCRCKLNKSFSCFGKYKSSKDGYSLTCKQCRSEYTKQFYIENKKRLIKKACDWQKTNQAKASRDKRRNKLREYSRLYNQNRKKNDPIYKLVCRLRTRLNQVLKDNFKKGSAVKDLGCTGIELKIYLQSKFQPGMTWENHGDWHIDHIIPLSSFDLTDYEQFKKANHYTNLQPLWAIDNLKKGNRI